MRQSQLVAARHEPLTSRRPRCSRRSFALHIPPAIFAGRFAVAQRCTVPAAIRIHRRIAAAQAAHPIAGGHRGRGSRRRRHRRRRHLSGLALGPVHLATAERIDGIGRRGGGRTLPQNLLHGHQSLVGVVAVVVAAVLLVRRHRRRRRRRRRWRRLAHRMQPHVIQCD